MQTLLTILLYIGGSVIIDFLIVLIVIAVLWWVMNLVLLAFNIPIYPSKVRALAWALFALCSLVFLLYRYFGVHLP